MPPLHCCWPRPYYLDLRTPKAFAGENKSMSGMAENPLLSLVTALAPAVAYKESNLEANKKVWNLYAKVSDRGRRDCTCASSVSPL